MQRLLWISSGFVLALIILEGVATYATPSEQTAPDGSHTHPRYETAIADLQTVDTILWGTLDTYAISTQVATFTATGTPTSTPPPTNTQRPSPTSTSTPLPPASPSMWPTATTVPMLPTATHTAAFDFASPTQEDWTLPTVTPLPTELPLQTYAVNIGSVVRNVRLCPSVTCEVVAVVGIGETVVIDLTQMQDAEGWRFYRLWNGSGWVTSERLEPYQRFLQW